MTHRNCWNCCWIDEVEEQLKENIAYQGMLEKISKYEEQVQTMGLAKEKRKTIDAYVCY